jgi:hypothetical protein
MNNKLALLLTLLAISPVCYAHINVTVGTDGFYADQGDHNEYHRHAEAARENFIEAKRRYDRHPTHRNKERMDDAYAEMHRYHENH